MPDRYRVRCQECGSHFKMKSVIPGHLPICAKCLGVLILPEPARLGCSACKKISKPFSVDLAKEVPCPSCKKPMALVRVRNTAVTKSEPEPETVSAKDETVTLQVQKGTSKLKSATVTASASSFQQSAPVLAKTILGKVAVKSRKPGKPDQSPPQKKDPLALAPVNEEPRKARETSGLRKEVFARYSIRGEIARGGMGIVYRVYDPDLSREVALKVMIAGEGATTDTILRFLREARAAGSLRHPNIVAVHEAGEWEGQHYFTMDLIDGKDLIDVIEVGATKMRTIFGYLVDVCRALGVAHTKGIIHRDLKPANIMIDNNGTPLIMDFGLAKDLTSDSIQSMTGLVFGTPAYMSPEQAQGRVHEIDHRTDIYAIGVMLYEIATGEKPFDGTTVFDTIEQVVYQEPEAPVKHCPHLGADLNTIILKCMDKDANLRYDTMGELADDLERYLNDEPIKARPRPKPVLLWRRLRKNTAALVAAIAIPAVLIVGVLVYLIFGGNRFLSNTEAAVRSGESKRATPAMAMLDNELREKRISNSSEKEWAVRISRRALQLKGDAPAITAMGILAREKDQLSLPLLMLTLQNEEQSDARRLAALKAIKHIGLTDEMRRKNAVHILKTLAEDEATSKELCLACITSMDSVGGNAGKTKLVEVAENKELPSEVRAAAIHSLGKGLRLHSPQMKILLRLQGDESEEVVRAADLALQKARGRVSIFALYGIQKIVGKTFARAGKVVQMNAKHQREMQALMDGNDADTGGRASRKIKANPVDIILKKLDAPSADVRLAAAYDLGVLGDASALPSLVGTLPDQDNSVRRSVALAILKIHGKHPQAALQRPQIRNLLKAPDTLVRENAAVLLGGLGEDTAVEALTTALAVEKSGRTIRAIVRALAAIGDTGGLAAIRAALDRSKGKTAVACIRGMIPFGRAAVPNLIHALKMPQKEIRTTAVAALKEISGEDFGSDSDKWQSWLEKSQPEK